MTEKKNDGTSWQAHAKLHGKLSTDEQEELASAGITAVSVTGPGLLELRFRVTGDDFAAATAAAIKQIKNLKPMAKLIAAGLVTGPHALTVKDQVAQADELDLVGRQEAAEILGVTPGRFDQLARREDFPEPAVRMAGGGLYERLAIELWGRLWDRRPGRPRRRVAE